MRSRYILRLDDAHEGWAWEKWKRVEEILDRHGVRPLVGIIPACLDPAFLGREKDPDFWDTIIGWQEKGWLMALHGCHHVYHTLEGGLNPIHRRSEFAGLPLEEQKRCIEEGVEILRNHGIEPQVFFAPSHTFDKNTLMALKECTDIRVISDTMAWDVYRDGEFTFVPQQAGRVRRLPFRTVTFCLHPENLWEKDWQKLDRFLDRHKEQFEDFPLEPSQRRYSFFDRGLRFCYLLRKRTKNRKERKPIGGEKI